MLKVEELTKRFGEFTALNDVSFSVDEGEIVGLLGENGAGKTTTLRLLAGALFPTSGRVVISGADMGTQYLTARRRVGYLPEHLPLDNRMRVLPYLDYVARLHGLAKRERSQAILRVMTDCGLADYADRGIANLSRGQRMRVGLAQALVHNPELLLLDEPTAGLDPQQVINMRRLILSLAGHHTILFSSHNLTEVSLCCTRVVMLKRGRVVAEDALAALEGRHAEEEMLFVRFAAPPENLAAHLLEVSGVTHAEPSATGGPGTMLVRLKARRGVREQFVEAVVGHGWRLCELREIGNDLADLFQRHVAEETAQPSGGDAGEVAVAGESGMEARQ